VRKYGAELGGRMEVVCEEEEYRDFGLRAAKKIGVRSRYE
jgi:hypothetical protein